MPLSALYLAFTASIPLIAKDILPTFHGHENIQTTEIYLRKLGVGIGAASIFEDITYENEKDVKKGFMQ